MSEREDESSEGSASTAEFRAFASGGPSESVRPWSMRAPARKVALLAAVVIVVAVLLVLAAILVTGG